MRQLSSYEPKEIDKSVDMFHVSIMKQHRWYQAIIKVGLQYKKQVEI